MSAMLKRTTNATPNLNRRAALARLGLTAAAIYAAPTVTRLDREALAQGLPSPVCPPGRPGCFNPGKGNNNGKGNG